MIDLLKSKESEQLKFGNEKDPVKKKASEDNIKALEDNIKTLGLEIESKKKEIKKLFDDSSNAIKVFVDKQDK